MRKNYVEIYPLLFDQVLIGGVDGVGYLPRKSLCEAIRFTHNGRIEVSGPTLSISRRVVLYLVMVELCMYTRARARKRKTECECVRMGHVRICTCIKERRWRRLCVLYIFVYRRIKKGIGRQNGSAKASEEKRKGFSIHGVQITQLALEKRNAMI